MTVRVYRWDDASAPVLSGAAGALIGVLDACLVNGYGAKAAAGWTKDFSGTNKAAYKQGIGSNGHYLRVDNATTATTARVVGYETMTDVDTGTGPFPTAAQIANGLYSRQSSTADSTARPWVVIATEKAFYLWTGYSVSTATGLATASATPILFFGDIVSNKTGDAYNTMLIAEAVNDVSGGSLGQQSTASTSPLQGHFIARSYTQTGGALQAIKVADYWAAPNSIIGGSGYTFPDPVTGGMILVPLRIFDVQYLERGKLPGVWGPLHDKPGAPGDTFTGTGDLAGKTFLLLDGPSAGSRARLAFEISDTW